MNEVKDLRVSRLPNGDFYQLIENIVTIVSNEPLAAGVIQTLTNDVPMLLNSYKKEQLTLETQQVVELDRKRDRAFLKFKYLTEAYAYDDQVPANIEASYKVQTFIKQHGGGKLVNFDYNKETASITSLIQELRTKAAAETLLLNLDKTVDYLESWNNDFKTFYASRGDAASVLANVAPFYKLRLDVAKHYKTFTKDLESLQRFIPASAGQIGDLITRVNVEIDKFRLLVPSGKVSEESTV